jgi:hypothetical protein
MRAIVLALMLLVSAMVMPISAPDIEAYIGGQYATPYDIEESDGFLYITEYGWNPSGFSILKQNASTLDLVDWTKGYAGFTSMRPNDLAVVNGSVYLIDTVENNIVKYDDELTYVSHVSYGTPYDYDVQGKSLTGGHMDDGVRLFALIFDNYNASIRCYSEGLVFQNLTLALDVADYPYTSYFYNIEFYDGTIYCTANRVVYSEDPAPHFTNYRCIRTYTADLELLLDTGWSNSDNNARFYGSYFNDGAFYALTRDDSSHVHIERRTFSGATIATECRMDITSFISGMPAFDMCVRGDTFYILGDDELYVGTLTLPWTPEFISSPVVRSPLSVLYGYDAEVNCTATFELTEAPDFLYIDTATGEVFGMPTTSGTYNVTIKATSTVSGGSSYQKYVLNIIRGTSEYVFTPPSGIDGYIVDGTELHVGTPYGKAYGTFYDSRTYISIDTSGVPSGISIDDVTLNLYVNPEQSYPSLSIWNAAYGTELTLDDWDSGETEIASVNGIWVGKYGSWVSITLSPSDIITGGLTQFEIRGIYGYGSSDIYLSNSSRAPYMTMSYSISGVLVKYLDHDGADVWSASCIAERQEYNVTHDAYTIEADTWMDGGLNITKPEEWTFSGATPYYVTSTVSGGWLVLNGTKANMTYRVQFLAPRISLSTAWISYFDPATGTGIAIESYISMISPGSSFDPDNARTVPKDFVRLTYGWTYTLVVLDYFGNVLASATFSTSLMEVFVNVPVDANSFKTFNQKEDFTKFRVYYENSSTPITYYCAPMESVERFLRDGNYTIGVTFYNNHTAGTTEWFNLAVSDAEFLMIQGDTISRVISDVAGVNALQRVITTMVTPDVVNLAEDLPMVPNDAFDSGIELVHPWSVVHGWAAGVEFTNETLFYYTYYTARKYYEVTLNTTNSDGVDWTNVTWFIGFPENRTIDYSSVRVYDLNNAVYLQAGLHYDMTLTGIRMKWTYFNDTLSRSFRISMYDANASSGGGMAIAVASEYSPSTYDGEPYYKSSVSWTNSFTYEYKGQYQVQFTFDDADLIKSSSVIVYDKNERRVLGEGEYTFAGGVLTVGNVNAVIGEVYGFDIYFKLDTSAADSWSIYQTFGGVPIWGWLVIATVVGILAMVIVDGKRTKGGRKLKLNGTAVAFALVMVSILFILWYFHQAGVL